jgi:hypothetical protein
MPLVTSLGVCDPTLQGQRESGAGDSSLKRVETEFSEFRRNGDLRTSPSPGPMP